MDRSSPSPINPVGYNGQILQLVLAQDLSINSLTILEDISNISPNVSLVGGWTNPSENYYSRQIGSFPQGSGWK